MELDLTDRQLDVMNVLWEEGSATVREVKEAIEDELAYTSVLTVFQILEENGHVRHEREGKRYRYYPTIGREEAGGQAVRYVLDRVFGGSVEAFLQATAEEANGRENLGEQVTATLGVKNKES